MGDKKDDIGIVIEGNIPQTAIAQALQQAIANNANSKEIGKSATFTSAVDLIMSQAWAIQPDMLQTIITIAQRKNETPEALVAKLGRPLQNTREVSMRDGVAVMPITGPIFRYANLFTQISGATSLDMLARDFNAALDDPNVSSIVLEIDSPGGVGTGISDFGQMIRAAEKPVIAYVEGLGASAAYWIAAAADEIVISKTGEVGSVGAVFGVYRKEETDVIEFVSSQSPMKRPDPETEAGREEFQKRIDTFAQVFIEEVADYRGVSVDVVLSEFGQGSVRLGAEAVGIGMADRVSTLEDLIAGLNGQQPATGGILTMDPKAKGKPAAETPVIDRAYLEENHGDLVAVLVQEGFDNGWDAGKTAECNRIKAVEEQLIPGYETLINSLKFDGETTGEQAAMKVVSAEKTGRTGFVTELKADAIAPVVDPNAPDTVDLSNLPTEERCKAEWDKDSALRAEFNDNFASYLAYVKAEEKGVVKIHGGKK